MYVVIKVGVTGSGNTADPCKHSLATPNKITFGEGEGGRAVVSSTYKQNDTRLRIRYEAVRQSRLNITKYERK